MDTAYPGRAIPDSPLVRKAVRRRRKRQTLQAEFGKFSNSVRGRALLAALGVTIVGAMIWQATPPAPAIEQPVLETPTRTTAAMNVAVARPARKHLTHARHHTHRVHRKARPSR